MAPTDLECHCTWPWRGPCIISGTGIQFLPLPDRSPVMDTDVMVMTSALLRAVNLQVFELGMWQSWTGR